MIRLSALCMESYLVKISTTSVALHETFGCCWLVVFRLAFPVHMDENNGYKCQQSASPVIHLF